MKRGASPEASPAAACISTPATARPVLASGNRCLLNEPACFFRAARVLLQVFLIFGRTGWIGGLVGQHLKEQGAKYEYANCRLEDRSAIISEIERVSPLQHSRLAAQQHRQGLTNTCINTRAQVKPTHVLNAAGLTGRPNVDWCETHRVSLFWGVAVMVVVRWGGGARFQIGDSKPFGREHSVSLVTRSAGGRGAGGSS